KIVARHRRWPQQGAAASRHMTRSHPGSSCGSFTLADMTAARTTALRLASSTSTVPTLRSKVASCSPEHYWKRFVSELSHDKPLRGGRSSHREQMGHGEAMCLV